MARPIKEGLDYFSLDTDIASDDKIKLIRAKHGLVGFAIVILLLTKIYREGYYYHWSEDEQYLFADETRTDIKVILTIVNECINRGFFHRKLYEKYGILTSMGIQKRYLKGCNKRSKLTLIREYFIADNFLEELKVVKITFTSVFGELTELPEEETPQSKVKESKVKNIDNSAGAREEIITEIQQQIKPITSQEEADLVNDLIDSYPHDWLINAIRIARSKPAYSFKFVDVIVRRWRTKGFAPDDKPWEVESHGKSLSQASATPRSPTADYSEYNNFRDD